jgi:hypothetical protein
MRYVCAWNQAVYHLTFVAQEGATELAQHPSTAKPDVHLYTYLYKAPRPTPFRRTAAVRPLNSVIAKRPYSGSDAHGTALHIAGFQTDSVLDYIGVFQDGKPCKMLGQAARDAILKCISHGTTRQHNKEADAQLDVLLLAHALQVRIHMLPHV